MASTLSRWPSVKASSPSSSALPLMTLRGVLRSWVRAASSSRRCCSMPHWLSRDSARFRRRSSMAFSVAPNSRTLARPVMGTSSRRWAMASVAPVSRAASRRRRPAK